MNKSGKKDPQLQKQGQESISGYEHTGAYLLKLRTERGLSLKQVSEETRISEINLRAMESQDFAALPADTFTRGLLHIYARYLGADPAHLVARFMRERDENQGHGKRGKARPPSRKILAPKKLAEPAHISSMTMAAGLLLLIVVLFTAFCLYTSWNPFSFLVRETDTIQTSIMQALPDSPAPASPKAEPEKQPAAPMPQVSQPQSAPPQGNAGQGAPVQTLPAASASPLAPSPAAKILALEIVKDVRLTLARGNEPPVSTPHKKGEKLTWPVAPSMELTFDQPDSAVIQVDGQPLAFPRGTNGRYTLHLPGALPPASAP